jgi:hypothetical protein
MDIKYSFLEHINLHSVSIVSLLPLTNSWSTFTIFKKSVIPAHIETEISKCPKFSNQIFSEEVEI